MKKILLTLLLLTFPLLTFSAQIQPKVLSYALIYPFPEDTQTFITWTPTGWIVTSYSGQTVSTKIFVPDPKHIWKLKEVK